MDRLDWFFQELVTQADLNTWQDNEENADHSVVADVLGFGFLISGTNPATVVQDTPTANLLLKANQFLGYEQAGRRVSNLRSGYQGAVNKGAVPQRIDMSTDENAAGTAVVTGGNEKTLSVFVQFTRNPYTPRTDGNNATVYFNQDESIQFNVVQSAEAAIGTSVAPPLRNGSNQLLLFDVKIVHSQTQILTGAISYARQQVFALNIPHGSSHVSTGSDPIPGATDSVGGLLSAADKTKLDGVTFTAAGVGALLNFQFAPFAPATITSPAATSLDVTSRLNSLAAGGSPSKEGVVTQTGAPDNIVRILNNATGNEIVSLARNLIYGRVTVDNETTPTAWTLSFFTLVAGVETAYDFTPLAGLTLQWRVTRSYRLDHLPSDAISSLVPRNQAASIPAVAGQRNGAGTTNYQPILNFIQGSNVTLTVVENTGNKSIDVTISAAGGGGGFPGFGSATTADSGSGSGGSSGLAADAGHFHALSAQYELSIDGKSSSGSSFSTATNHPRIAAGVWSDGTASGKGVAFGTSGPTQGSVQGGSGNNYNAGFFSHSTGGSSSFSAWANGSQTLTASGGTLNITYFVLGQIGF